MTNSTPVPVQRPDPRRKRAWWGCGCALIAPFAAVLICTGLYAFGLFNPLSIGLRLLGVSSLGDTDEAFAEAVVPPTVEVENAEVPERVEIDLGGGRDPIVVNPGSYNVVTGSTSSGQQIATATFTEADLLRLCNERSALCSTGDDRFRNATFDLRPGGGVVYVEVNAQVFWQRIGVVLRLNSDRTSFDVYGVDIAGTTYDPLSLPSLIPADARARIVEAVNEVETTGNDILQQISAQTGGQNYQLSDIIIDDNTLTIVMR